MAQQSIPLILQEDYEQGGKEYEEDIENDFAYRNNVKQASREVRFGFIRKVYSLLAFQLILTVIIAAVFMFTPPIKEFIHKNDWLMMIAMFSSFGLLIALHIKRKDTPTNFILLTAFTVVLAYSLGVTITYFEKAVVLQALGLTVLIVAVLTLFTFQTKYDLSSMHSILFAGLLILIVGGFMQIFLQSTVFEIILSLGGAFIFSIFIIVDTQMIMEKLSAEEYILATINLYLDIVNLFIYILRLLEAMRQ
ncbi:protein lifeguard 4-like [Onthophagus taurus]|uniref:protein lifeguard 4-like n=1 Tax=Onthophagus taurus TaxID=166361 RepID=UPI000C20BDE1|nr:protein lifeguard 4-like isoform X1 [Onthophagus taurus]XP_022906008.1 protein lifeguard 4-like isoform X1 [Onthophagus taurus]XP_022906009.1 protein lifeguard 4-like isoform X1 [Onthophagus taurus]XP_022906010.1 protein lifeguard 4-like isoform X1 [Onthophagus taurus]XP_022906011.1 protein lifeguard 4-like isoform X2 [Onthophagus taurus]